MNIRAGAVTALLVAVIVTIAATTGVAATPVAKAVADATATDVPLLTHASSAASLTDADRGAPAERGAVLSGTPTAAPTSIPTRTRAPTRDRSLAPQPANEVVGIGSNYPGTAGWMGQATVALPGDLGGRYTGQVNGYVTVCADRCARLPVVDWCQCHWATGDQRIVDLSHPAWRLVTNAPLAEGLIEVRLIIER